MKTVAIEDLIVECVLTFCENAAELGCPREEENVDMWFRYLSPEEQNKVSEKMMKIMERNSKKIEKPKISNYREALKRAKEIDKELRVGEHFTHVVHLKHGDKTQCEFHHADLRKEGDWSFIFTEHHGFFVYHVEDLEDCYEK